MSLKYDKKMSISYDLADYLTSEYFLGEIAVKRRDALATDLDKIINGAAKGGSGAAFLGGVLSGAVAILVIQMVVG